MNKKQDERRTILLEESGKVYQSRPEGVVGLSSNEVAQIVGLETIMQDPTQHFFKVPYHSAVYVVEETVMGSVGIHPSSFYPGSPFDTFRAIKQFYTTGKLVIPRFYLYPSGVCNSSCNICQFYNLDRFEGKQFSERFVPYETVERVIEEFNSMESGFGSVSVVVSGDGEPTEHPDIARILDKLKHNSMRIFLTSNLRLPRDRDGNTMRSIIDTVAMITVSIKGLNDAAYDQYQGTTGKFNFGKVLDNLGRLIVGLEESGRREEVLVGVATLLLPENTDSYNEMINRFIQLGIDYVYINPVEPSYNSWGIKFSERQVKCTEEFLDSLNSIDCCNTVIRYPGNLRLDALGENVYFNATNRENKEVCGSALWNPTVITTDTRGKTGARILSCRSSQNFGNSDFWFIDGWNTHPTREDETEKIMGRTHELSQVLAESAQKVMDASLGCTECRLERQVRMFDQAITLMKKYDYKGKFLLEFDVADLIPRGKAITFEQTK